MAMWRDEKESGIDVSEGFAANILDTFAVPPPMPLIVIWIRDRNDANCNVLPESFAKEEASATRVRIFGHNIDALHSHIVLTEPLSQGDGGSVCSIPIHDA
jgi:hypothetical protein